MFLRIFEEGEVGVVFSFRGIWCFGGGLVSYSENLGGKLSRERGLGRTLYLAN